MEWTADASAGDWLRERLDDGDAWGSSMHGVVPHGYAAYARLFHRASVSSRAGGRMPSQQEWQRMSPAESQAVAERIRATPATWRETALAFGTEWHPLAQWNRLVGGGEPGGWQSVLAPDGREFDAPQEGWLDPDVLARVATHLSAHTTTPGDGFAAVWEGHGGLVGFLGETPSRTFLSFSSDEATTARHNEMVGRSIRDPFNNVFRKPAWQPGILSDEISQGPRLELPARSHVLFRGGIDEFTDADWTSSVPWHDGEGAAVGLESTASPSLLWPVDRAWVLVTEVDYDSTIVGGSTELIAAIIGDPSLEALAVAEGADLSWGGDGLNT